MMKVYQSVIPTPIGSMIAFATQSGVCLLEFSQRRKDQGFNSLSRYFEIELCEAENDHLNVLKLQLDEYFDGKRKEFTVPLHYPGTDFQQKTWEALLKIPYGSTRSYRQQSILLENPGAIRAVGTANGANRISILIPCHRVIGEDGNLTGYAGGLHRKKWLLEHEQGNLGYRQEKLF